MYIIRMCRPHKTIISPSSLRAISTSPPHFRNQLSSVDPPSSLPLSSSLHFIIQNTSEIGWIDIFCDLDDLFQARVVWDKAVGGKFEMREHSVDFSEMIGTTAEAFRDYKRAKISRAAFLIGTFLNLLIKNENQVSSVKVVVVDDMLMAFFEVCDGSEIHR